MVKDKKGSVAGSKAAGSKVAGNKGKEANKEESKCICEICTCG